MLRSVFGMRTIAPHTPSYGSSHDPVLHGVADGLADLFPLVEQPAHFVDDPDATAAPSPAPERASEAEV
jgi:hypothetical protein